ncbi:protein ITPRID1 [Scyliorhinus canicula]|uniref:protein ITPRID1 n=1 Tax=Scyliorhinus canicula TaxID=7830 RepID=UPI0018F74027|nr:protein ITPRID1 [Scyliorhinus canicula]
MSFSGPVHTETVVCNLDKTERGNLASMKEMWKVVDRNSSGAAADDLPSILHTKNDYKQQSVQEWLNTSCTLHANEHRPQSPQRTGILKRMYSIEDDLMLGVEANLYPSGMQNMSVQDYMRTLHTCSEKQTLSRWNSMASATSVASGPKSVVELLNLWHHDPEDLLLDLGFGKEEADISAKIPARFINSSSVATGINLGVFLDAQKLRMEMESHNLYNRFQQLEALQKANDMFSSLYTEIVNESLSSELTTEEQQHLETKEKCRKMLRKLSRDMNDSQSFVASNEEVSGKDRQAAFHRAHQCIPEDSVLAPLTAAQNEVANKALDMPLNMKEGQVCTSLEMGAKGRDGESRLITFQTKKLKICTSNQPPDSFEMEEVQSFDEDSCPRMAANKIFLDLKRENSCQSDSSGFLEEPFIPLQIQRALQNVSDDSIRSQATLQENGQWPSGSSDPEQATDSFIDQTCIAGSVDSDQTQCSETHTMLCVLQKEKIFNVENFDSRPPASSNHQMIAAPCAEKNTEEINSLAGSTHYLHTTPLETTRHRSALNTSTWPSNEIYVQNGAGVCQNDNSVRSNAPSVSTNQENFNLAPQNSTGTSKLVTFQISQDKLQQRNIMFHSSEPLPLLLQPNKDSPMHENVFRESRVKLRDAVVQTDEITGDCATERHRQVKNCNLLAFQSGGLLKKSASLDTGLHNIENNAQEPTAIHPAHCHHCHHCSCHHHHCSSTWFNEKDGKTAVSHTERQLIKTLQQLQQTARIISASPHAFQEVETMKKSLFGFRNRLLDLEQQITEQQASVYNVLTEDERDDMKRLRNLRQAVRHEVTEMEVQLEDRTRQLGEGMGMQFQSLVEEQSSFCSYIEDLRQRRDASSGSWPWSSSSCAIPTPAPVTTSQEPDCAAGTTQPVLSVSGLSPAPSASDKTDTDLKLESDKDAEPKAKKHNQHSEMLDFRGFLLNIKQSFQQLRSPSPEPTESINH